MPDPIRIPITAETSTVLGYRAKPYWPNLHFDHAQVRRQSLVGALAGLPSDVHLAVPWRHPDDAWMPLEDCGRYSVRCRWGTGQELRLKGTPRARVASVRPEQSADGVWWWAVERSDVQRVRRDIRKGPYGAEVKP